MSNFFVAEELSLVFINMLQTITPVSLSSDLSQTNPIWGIAILAAFIAIAIWRYQAGKRKRKRDAAKPDFKLEDLLVYNRELPASYSPAIVSVLEDYEHEVDKDVPAEILNLCAKGYLRIEPTANGKEYLFAPTGKPGADLPVHERYVLQWALRQPGEFDFSMGFYEYRWKTLLLEEAHRLGLLSSRDDIAKIKRRATAMHMLRSFILALPLTFFTVRNMLDIGSVIIIAILGVLAQLFYTLLIAGISYLFLYLPYNLGYAEKLEYTRSPKGKEDYKKWLGLKQYLLDFTLIQERYPQEVVLWEYYLAYATALGIADQINQQEAVKMMENSAFHINNFLGFKHYVQLQEAPPAPVQNIP